ncbi:hypothetical protein [Streptomyces sp. NPDC017940]|uniref:hypothetical protein n=1 Tax=Streptomyces sp. NPDC017940 TaxID=3365017 RepID=UPI00379E03A8
MSSHLLVIRSAAPRRSIGHFIEPAGRPGPHRADDWFGGWCELPDDSTLTDAEALRRALEEQSADEPTRPETTATTEPRHGTL